jgi:hypothetical protein
MAKVHPHAADIAASFTVIAHPMRAGGDLALSRSEGFGGADILPASKSASANPLVISFIGSDTRIFSRNMNSWITE